MASDDLRAASDAQLVVSIGRFRQDALAEEIVQDVFLRLWNDPERFDPGRGSLRAYLLAQTHGRAVDLLRAEVARKHREERDARRTPVPADDLEREVWELTLAEQVRGALEQRSSDERDAIGLAYFGGHSYREVASLLGAPEGTVKSRIRSGLGRLRQSLVATGYVEDAGPWAEN